ncbi:MAG: LD-carboxypeptidase [Treponema sp.]|nr:LD-carboxypeptidase [Treponema sp.]
MRFPQHITPGQTIGVTAPSFGASSEPYISRFDLADRKFAEAGYQIKAGATCHMSDGLGISTNPERAAQELEEFYLDDGIQAIISCGGGELMCETVGHIDFLKLGEVRPKWFMGYSDNTNFIFPMATIAGVAGIYGPTFTGFGKPWEQAETDALALLEGKTTIVRGYSHFQSPEADYEATVKDPFSPYVLDTKKQLKTFIPKGGQLMPANDEEAVSASGILLGGCLDVLANLCGTKLDNMKTFNREHGAVAWVLESCDGNPMEIRRQIWHLDNAGWFGNASLFVIGRPLASWQKSMMGVDQYNAVTDILAYHKVPVIMDADVGHISPTVPLVIGAETAVHAQGNELYFELLHEAGASRPLCNQR